MEDLKCIPALICHQFWYRWIKWNNLWILFNSQLCNVKHHRIIEWPGLKRTTVIQFQPPCYVQGRQSPDQAAQSHIQPGLECFQGWGIHNLLGQPVPVRHHSLCEKIHPNIYCCRCSWIKRWGRREGIFFLSPSKKVEKKRNNLHKLGKEQESEGPLKAEEWSEFFKVDSYCLW